MKIAIQNHSTVLTDAEVQAVIGAMQTQVSRDFGPAWSLGATLCWIASTSPVPTDHALLGVFDDADQAGALGYHDLTASDQPIGKVFARTTQQFGGQWTVTFSHELLEMIADPSINICRYVEFARFYARFYAQEVCDAVEADELGYTIDGVLVSDFVLPAWFDALNTTGPFSFRQNVRRPFALAPGGYIGYSDGNGWQQETASSSRANVTPKRMHDALARPGSRRERRARSRQRWQRSER